MKNLRYIVFALIAAMTVNIAFTSCLDEETTTEIDNDLYIGSIELGNLKRVYRYINARGNDTTSYVTVVGSQFALTIDQKPDANGYCHIYNVDSLPKHTIMEKVVFSSMQAYNGVVAIDRIQPLENEKDTAYVFSDSTDFSRKRYFTLYGRDGVSRRTYEVDLRVHQEYGDSLRWQLQGVRSDVAAMTHTKALFRKGAWYLFGTNAGNRQVLTTEGPKTINAEIDTRSVTAYGDMFYALSGTSLMASADGYTWNVVLGAPALSGLFGTWSQGLVACNTLGKMVRTNGLSGWLEDETEAGYPMPNTDVTAISKFKDTDAQLEDLIIVGQKDGETHIWKSTIEHLDDDNRLSYGWNYLPQDSENYYPCPVLRQPSVINYDKGALLIGTGLEADTLANPLFSEDYGRTWKRRSYMNFDLKFGTNVLPHPSATPAVAVAVNDDHYIWVFCQGSGEIWRGRINRLGWKEEQKTFMKTQRR